LKNRSGNALANLDVFVEPDRSASSTTTSFRFFPRLTSASPYASLVATFCVTVPPEYFDRIMGFNLMSSIL
jgi:hypothetical protein